MQIILLIGNIARLDFPSKWPDLLTFLLAPLLEPQKQRVAPQAMQGRQVRCLRACKYVARALKDRRVVAFNGGLFMPRRDGDPRFMTKQSLL